MTEADKTILETTRAIIEGGAAQPVEKLTVTFGVYSVPASRVIECAVTVTYRNDGDKHGKGQPV